MTGRATSPTAYIGRFAPSPTGPLHAGSLVAALASWLDARAAGGTWLVRIEDVDTPRCQPGAGDFIVQQLALCGLLPDAPVQWQSKRSTLYETALAQLVAAYHAYPCACSRKDIELAQGALGHARERHTALPYPGTCRQGLQGRIARSWRFNTTDYESNRPPVGENNRSIAIVSGASATSLHWHDRRLGAQQQDVAREVGDFVLRRADGLWAYQLAVVVDDGAQGITHVVRGADLTDNTPRQILLQQALGLPTPQYLHVPLVWGEDGEKLSKQNGAQALALDNPAQALLSLSQAACALGLPPLAQTNGMGLPEALAQWVKAWQRNYNGPS